MAFVLASLRDLIGLKLYLAGVLLGLLSIPAVLASRKTAQAKVAWILLLVASPWIGVLLYAAFGRNRLKRKVVRLRRAAVAALGPTDARLTAGLASVTEGPSQLSRDLVREAMAVSGALVYPGNRLELLPEGPAFVERMTEAIDSARHHVHVLVYIFKEDRAGHAALDALVRAARRGVEVRLVYDALGTYGTRGRFFDPLREAGGRVAPFLPVRPLRQLATINLRNHRKITIVDGRRAFLGGRNVGDEYASDPLWRDLHGEVEGPAVAGLQRVFVEDWNFATDELLDDDRYFSETAVAGDVPIQVIPCGPDRDERPLESVFFSAIANARSSVDLATPYFVPTEPLLAALRSALARGRRVRVLTGERVDHRVVRWASLSLLPPLVEAGLEVWLHPGMIHSKVLVADDWGTFGSANFDARSLRLNFEVNVALPHPPSAERLRAYVEAEIGASRRLRPADLGASWPRRVLRNAAGLLAPVL